MKIFTMVLCALALSSFIKASEITLQQTPPYQTYLLAHFNHLNSNHDVAHRCYEQLLQQTQHPCIYEGYAHHLFQTEQFPQLITIVPLLEKHMPNNVDTQLLCAHTMEVVGKRQDACNKLTALSTQFPNNPEVIYHAAASLAQNNQNDAAVKLIDSFLSSTSESMKHFIFYFLKAQINAAVGNKEGALNNVKKCLELNDQFDQGWLLYGLLNELAGELDSAINGYNQCLQLLGPNELLERQIMQLQMRKHHQELTESNQELFKKAHDIFTAKNYEEALTFIDSILKKSNHLPSRLLKIEILCRLGKVPQALSLLQEWATADPHNEVWYKTLMLLYQAGAQPHNVLAVFKTLEKNNPKNMLPLLYQADFYIKNDQKQDAKLYLQKSLSLCTDHKIKARTLFQLALVLYDEQHQEEAMQKALEEACALSYEFPPAFNLLAYHYATTDHLDKAQECIGKALAKDPHNPHFLDTQAVIWHKKKEFNKAYDTLLVLSQQLPNDCQVHQHLAQTAHHLGQHTVAQQALKKAQTLGAQQKNKGVQKKVVTMNTK